MNFNNLDESEHNSIIVSQLTLPGIYVPEVKGKEVYIISERYSNGLNVLVELRGSPLREEVGEPLKEVKAFNNLIESSDTYLGELIEKAAKRYFDRDGVL